MPLEIQLIDDFDHEHETQMWEKMVDGLQKGFKDDGRLHVLIGNFQCERQFDALYIAPRGACIVELKAYSGQLYAPTNGKWIAGDDEVESSGGLNPLKQIHRCKFAFSDRVVAHWRSILRETPSPEWRRTWGRVVFNSPLECDGKFEHGTRKWFAVTDIDRISHELLAIDIDDFGLSDDQIRLAKNAALGIEPRRQQRSASTKSRWLYLKESEFNDGLRQLLTQQGEAQIAANIFRGFNDKLRAGKNPLADVAFDSRPEIEDLRAYRLTPNHRLLLIHHHGKNYLLMIGSVDAAESWIEANQGFIFTVDAASGRIGATQKDVVALDSPTAITTDNVPFLERVENTLKEADIPLDELRPLAELDENSSEEMRDDAIDSIADPELRELMRDVTELIRTGKEEQANTRLKLYGGSAIPLSDAPELQEEVIASGSNSERLVDLGEMQPSDFDRFLKALDDDTWMHFLHPGQNRVVTENYDKPAILTGVSGSGKTSVLMHRARRLAADNPGERVLVLTLNKNLARLISIGMHNFCDPESRARIEVISFHEYLAQFLESTDVRGFLENFAEYTGQQEAMSKLLSVKSKDELPGLFRPLEETALRELFHEFLEQLEGEDRDSLGNLQIFLDAQSPGIDAENYIYEELELIRSTFPCFDDYGAYLTDFERQGRGIGLQRSRKEQMLQVLKLWERQQINFQFFDHMGLTQAAFLAFEENGGIPERFRYRFVLVDEFQDLSDLELRILTGIPKPGSNNLFLTGDFAQKLYAKQLNLSEVGLGRDNRTLRSIRKNYRNSRQILEAADRLLVCWPGTAASDSDLEVLRPEFASRETSKPAAYRAADPVLAAWRDVYEAIYEYKLPSQAVCVISANTLKYPIDEILEACPDGIAASALTEWSSDDELRSVPVADITSVKGFEFKVVYIIGLEDGSFPASGRHEEEVWRDAQRLYVAITRGMNEVRMYHHGEPSVMLKAMEDAIDFLEAKPIPSVSDVVSVMTTEKDETDVAASLTEDTSDIEVSGEAESAIDGECWTSTIVNGIRFLVFERRPDQLELATAAGCMPAHIQHLLFHDHNLALVPINRLEKHLVEKLCHSMGYIAEFRDTPAPVPIRQPEPVVEVIETPETVEVEEETKTVVNVPEEGIALGSLVIGTLEREFADFRTPFGQRDLVDAWIKEYSLTGPEGLRLLVHDVRMKGHDRYVTCGLNATSDPTWTRLVNRLRLGIKLLTPDTWVMELRQARMTTGKWSSRFRATPGQLEAGAGLDVPEALLALAALKVGTKEEVYGETNRNRRQYCVTFAEGNTAVPLAAYAAVTVLPLLNGYRAEDAADDE